jgi:hypothetical protein
MLARNTVARIIEQLSDAWLTDFSIQRVAGRDRTGTVFPTRTISRTQIFPVYKERDR